MIPEQYRYSIKFSLKAVKTIHFPTKGVCAQEIQLEIQNGIITQLQVVGGCDGNCQGLALLTVGSNAEEIAQKLSGVRCGFKKTSCPDQIAKAIRQYLAKERNQ